MNGTSNDPEDIDAILAQAFEKPEPGTASFSHEVDLAAKGVDLNDDTLEASLIREDARKDGVHIPDLPEPSTTAPDSLFESDPVATAKDELMRAFSGDFDFGNITINELERDRFYRCGLHDEEMFYDVDVPGADIRCRVVIPSVSQSEAAVTALGEWTESGAIGTNNIQTLHAFQLLNVWLMVRSVNDKPTDWFEGAAEKAGGKLGYRALRKVLSDPDVVDGLRDTGEVRWKALTTAVLIADYKHQLCLEAIRSRKVFTTAGSA